MTWKVIYHKDVDDDLKNIGPAAARRIILTINEKLTKAPEKFEAPLSNNLKNFRKLRIGDFRVVCQIRNKEIIVPPGRINESVKGNQRFRRFDLAGSVKSDQILNRKLW